MRKPYVRRSPRWPALKNKHLKAHPTCEVCGRKSEVTAHHIVPVHVDPTRELDPDNLLTMCEGKVMNCHCVVGHLWAWISYNPTVRQDAETIRKRIANRPGKLK